MNTHIWMPADLLDDILVEMTSVAQKATGNVECMAQALKDIVIGRKDGAAFPQLLLGALGGQM